ncbi:RNA 2'-phosphotransferase [Desulfoferrobacter suflitae]|uniref:RNA 2'-phosphotransferase n=1 Tax=Desulfoferrobacter suflitae TaxID=2865782 RepID=UPI0021644E2C|nr:RNA 2'-phosphotransferase [Desulfoferrobacter suflitae]MCK8600144.1 RNA 2'-phosphotransferase [Desulfoferrobacter suflitae]
MDKHLIKLSKFLSLVLRHKLRKIGLSLDEGGWASVDELIQRAREHGVPLDLETLQEVVEQNDKQRFTISDDGRKIRANQGHSIPVDLGLEPMQPPDQLYHGTSSRFLESIKLHGIRRRKRHHVHLSPDRETAFRVGQRHGWPVVLTVLAGRMHQSGYLFYLSANGVWLVSQVPPEFIVFP